MLFESMLGKLETEPNEDFISLRNKTFFSSEFGACSKFQYLARLFAGSMFLELKTINQNRIEVMLFFVIQQTTIKGQEV